MGIVYHRRDNLTWATSNGQLVGSAYVPAPAKTTYLNHSLGGDIGLIPSFTLVASGGESFIRAKAELDCVVPPQAPSMALGWNNVSVMTWPPNGMTDLFGMYTQWNGADHNGTTFSGGPTSLLQISTLRTHLWTVLLDPQSCCSGASGLGPAFTVVVSNASSNAECALAVSCKNLASTTTRFMFKPQICALPQRVSPFTQQSNAAKLYGGR